MTRTNDDPLGAVFLRSCDTDEVLVKLAPSATLELEGILLRHEGDEIVVEARSPRREVTIGGVRTERGRVRPPCLFEVAGLRAVIERAPDRDVDEPVPPLPGLVGRSRAMLDLSRSVRRFAEVSLPLLVRGESGTGKDLVARAVHELGPRKRGPFVAINAATISRDLAESELFGHARGAFTGALTERRGAFREAHGGTLLIDEIAALGPEVQAKLLRVVEDGVVRPLGGEAKLAVDVRLVVATCEPLEDMVEAGRFREDLYERLAVCIVRVPSLHERAEDIPALAAHLVDACRLDATLSPRALQALMTHRYRGNVRELRNVVAQAALRARGRHVDVDDVLAVFAARAAARKRVSPVEALHTLQTCHGNVSAAARRVNLPRSTLRDLLRRARDEDAHAPTTLAVRVAAC
jgi:DNA-binding NtrC family response regulator